MKVVQGIQTGKYVMFVFRLMLVASALYLSLLLQYRAVLFVPSSKRLVLKLFSTVHTFANSVPISLRSLLAA